MREAQNSRIMRVQLELPDVVVREVERAARKQDISARLYILAALTAKVTGDGFLLKREAA
jgi:hypothetical protein